MTTLQTTEDIEDVEDGEAHFNDFAYKTDILYVYDPETGLTYITSDQFKEITDITWVEFIDLFS